MWKLILPTLLHGKLVDSYVTLSETFCDNLGNVKKALMESVRIPITAGQMFMNCH